MFNSAIDSKLRGCDVVALRVEDIAPGGYAVDRATVRQKKTGRPVKFELTDQTGEAVAPYLRRRARGQVNFSSLLLAAKIAAEIGWPEAFKTSHHVSHKLDGGHS
jgi:hypothetical protein